MRGRLRRGWDQTTGDNRVRLLLRCRQPATMATKPNADKVGACTLSPIGVGCTALPGLSPSTSGVRANVHLSCRPVNTPSADHRDQLPIVPRFTTDDADREIIRTSLRFV